MREIDFEQFVAELDAAVQAHLEWTRRVLRCAVLKTSPGNEILDAGSSQRCHFGRWFAAHRDDFAALDANRIESLETAHHAMHAAIGIICERMLAGLPGESSHLDRFETTQHQLIEALAHYKTLAVGQSSQIDPLTRLPLRHRLEQDFDLLARHVRRRGDAQLLLMVDVDHFKAVNDRYGHAGGDAVLQAIAVTLRQAVRENDLVYRYGGEEFLLLMDVSSSSHAEDLTAQRVLESLRQLAITLADGAVVRPTATIGVARAGEEETLAQAIQRADQALYRGKAAGRNRYVVAGRE